MTVSRELKTISVPAAGDLSSNQYRIVNVDSDGKAEASDATTDVMVGVLQNKPGAANRAAEIAIDGVSKLEAGAAINEGDKITAVAGGRGSATTAATAHYVGVALTAAAGSGALFEVLINPGQAV